MKLNFISILLAGALLTFLILVLKERHGGPVELTSPSQFSDLEFVEIKPQQDIQINKKFKGKWNTVKGKILDGEMICEVLTEDQKTWKGTFHGVWQGVAFSYDVDWIGPVEHMTGKAVVDGVNYEWNGSIIGDRFKGDFESPRYDGSFDLIAD